MARVHFVEENRTIEVEQGTTLSACIRQAGLFLETPCNCLGLCGKCKVLAAGSLSEPTEQERTYIGDGKGVRLACLAKVTGDAEVRIKKAPAELRTVDRGYMSVDASVEKRALEIGSMREVLGVAVDIGTTGVSAYLVDLRDGSVLKRISCLNPQTRYGSDVLSRITYCMTNPKGLEHLKDAIVGKINELIGQLTGECCREKVHRVTITGNTTMLHLFMGIDPMPIAKAPYRPVFIDKQELIPQCIGIPIHPEGRITLLPSASGYVGADILAGVAATSFDKKTHAAVFIDIGTNGEIVAIADGRMAATSTAAGPALEGMNISCGCRAEAGAIDTFEIDEDFNVSYTTIDGAAPAGICGSGLIDVAAAFVKREVVLKSGKFNPAMDHRIRNRLRDKAFHITGDIAVTQKDVRQIQLAKGAIAAGVSMLLKEIGVPVETVREAVIAGAFGYHINPESIKAIGLIPKGFQGEISFVGNSSVEGARLALTSSALLRRMEALQHEIAVIELSTRDDFQPYFIKELSF